MVLCIGNALNQHATFDYHEGLFDGKVQIRVNISETEITKVYPPDYALVSDARAAVSAVADALEAKVGEVKRAHVDHQDYEARHIPDFTPLIHPGRLAQSIGRMLPPTPSCWLTPARTWPGLVTSWSSRKGRTSVRLVSSGRWPGT